LLGRLDLELTERCNNDCLHCYVNLPADDQEAAARELPTERIEAILREAAELGAMKVRFTGGEPLLRDDFEHLYLLARRLGLTVIVFTNATLITEHLADLWALIPPLEKIEVSVYGMTQRSYEAATRTPGSFSAARRGVELLLERAIPFVVRGALLPPNRHEADEFDAWAAGLPGMYKPPGRSLFFDLRTRRDSEARNRLVRGLRASPEQGHEVLARGGEQYLRERAEFCSKFIGSPGDRLFTCGSGVGGACVDAYGKLQPCMLLRHPEAVYDLETGSLQDAMTRFFPALRERRAANADYLARCARCFLKGLCEQCPAKSWSEHGTLDTPVQYLCDVAHVEARALGLLCDGEAAWEVGDWRERVSALRERWGTSASPAGGTLSALREVDDGR